MLQDNSRSSLATTFATLHQFYHQAEQQYDRCEQFYAIAGYTFCLRFAGAPLLSSVTRSFAHLTTAPTSQPDLTICIAAGRSSGAKPTTPTLPPGLYHQAATGLHYAYYAQWQGQEAFAPSHQLGFLVVDDPAAYPAYAHAAPLRNLLSWWLAHKGHYGLHAAAVGNATHTALIIGHGGAGKSTTAIACLQAGFTYLGDDFCLLMAAAAPVASPWAHTLYSSGKLGGDSRRWLSPLPAAASCMDEDGKMVYQWFPHFQGQLPARLPIGLLLLPQLSSTGHSAIRPASPSEAFTVLATTTIRVMSLPKTAAQPLLLALKQLVQQVPAYHLRLGTDTTQLPTFLRSVIEEQGR
ncbi:MAG: hypothetical protein KF832_25590 [Caldilineaceae bacterium]|nr:hypothetical protein [Caldilineaceae bacterium]